MFDAVKFRDWFWWRCLHKIGLGWMGQMGEFLILQNKINRVIKLSTSLIYKPILKLQTECFLADNIVAEN